MTSPTVLGFGTSTFFGNTVRASTCLVADSLCSLTPGAVILPIQGAGLGATDLVNSAGLVNISASGAPLAGYLLVASGPTTAAWVPDPGPGDVVGPGSSTDNAIARFDGATGKLIQNSGTTLDDAGNLAGPAINTPATATSLGQGVGTLAANDTFLGADAGSSNTTGTENTFIGTDAGSSNSTGDDNTFIGASAGAANTVSGNTFVGSSAGASNTAGIGNVFVGQNAGEDNTFGGANTFIGRSAGSNNTVGSDNTFVGVSGGVSNTTGSRNTFLGSGSGIASVSGDDNTLVGRDAGEGITTGSGNTIIGKDANKTGAAGLSGCVIIGLNAGDGNTTSDRLMIHNTSTSTPLLDGSFVPASETLQINGLTTIGPGPAATTHHNINAVTDAITAPGGGGAPALPAAPVTYVLLEVGGATFRIPLYT